MQSEMKPDCFEHDQDVVLMHSAIISAHRCSGREESDSLQGLSDEQLSVVGEIILSSLDFIAKKLEGKIYRKNEACRKSPAERRIHAVVLYNVLHSHGIRCKEASEYFASIEGILPKIDWRLYFYLQKICGWDLLFFDQMIQVPPGVLVAVVHQISKEIDFGKDSSLSALSSVLQVLLGQLFVIKNPVSSKSVETVNFGFPFSVTNESGAVAAAESLKSVQDGKCDGTSSNSITSNDVVSLLAVLDKRPVDVNLVKVILWGLTTLLDKILKCKSNPESQVLVDVVKVFLQFSKKMLSREKTKSVLSDAFKTFKFDEKIVGNCLDEHIVMMVFWMYSKLDCVFQIGVSAYGQSPAVGLSWLEDLRDDLDGILKCLPPFPLSSDIETDIDVEEFIKLAAYLTGTRERIRHYALKVLIRSPEFLARQDVIGCIERQWQRCTSDTSVIITLMNSVLKMQGPKRNSMIEVFVAIFNHLNIDMRKAVIRELISQQQGLSDFFKLPYFESDFKSCNKNATVEQAAKSILSLCLQSQKQALCMIMDKQFTHGHMKTVTQALKEVDFICSYKESKDSLPLLIKILQPHFSSEISARKQGENTTAIILSLIETFRDIEEAFPVNVLIESCIFPNLHTNDVSGKSIFLLTLLNAVLTNSLESNNVKWVSKLVAPPLIVHLCQVISTYIVECKGFAKSLAVNALLSFIQVYNKLLGQKKFFLSDESKKWIKSRLFQQGHPLVVFYIWNLIGLNESDVQSTDIRSLVFWLAVQEKKKDLQMLKGFLEREYATNSRTALVLTITQLLPHLTAEEMLALCISLSCSDLKFLQSSEEPDIPINEKEALGTISVFVDALFLLTHVEDEPLNWAYIMSSFGQTVKVICDEKFCISTYRKIFLELCRLIGKTAEGNSNVDVMLQRVLGKVKDDKDLYRQLSSIMYKLQ